jgi:hypothetical protein
MLLNSVGVLEIPITNIRKKSKQTEEKNMDSVNVGDKIKIITMQGEPQYTNREGVVTHIDDAGQIHGTWGGCAVIPSVDTYIIIDR